MSPSQHPAEDQRVPTLTEVIDLPSAQSPAAWAGEPVWRESAQPLVEAPQWAPPPASEAAFPVWDQVVPACADVGWHNTPAEPALLAPAPIPQWTPASVRPAPVDAMWEAELNQRILGNVQRQVDLMLDYRLREALMPTLARLADTLVRDLRVDLASTLQDVVARAVAQELARQRSR
jgi:hypothetical protein